MSGQFPAGNYQFEIVERQLLRLTEGSKRESRIPVYDINIKCQRMVGQCHTCSIGRTIAVCAYIAASLSYLSCVLLLALLLFLLSVGNIATYRACWFGHLKAIFGCHNPHAVQPCPRPMNARANGFIHGVGAGAVSSKIHEP